MNSENFFRLNPAIRIEFYFRTHNLNKLKRDKQEINNEKNDERTILVAPRPRLENGGSLRLPVELSGKLSQAPARYRTEPCLFRSQSWGISSDLDNIDDCTIQVIVGEKTSVEGTAERLSTRTIPPTSPLLPSRPWPVLN